MYDYHHILVQMRAGNSDRSIAKTGLAGREKLGTIRAIAKQAGWLEAQCSLPDMNKLADYFNRETKNNSNESKVAPYAVLVTKWHEQGIQASTIYQALVDSHQFSGSYSSVARFIQKLKSLVVDVTIPLTFKPGESAQVDFGQGPALVDPETKKLRSTYFFVMTLSWSRHQYAELVYDQSILTWLGCHRRAFEWFNGVPGKVIIDNPKCAITKACYYQPTVQRAYAECAEGYGFMISPCPVRDPKKKGRVESGVKYVKKNFTPLRQFKNLADANAQLKSWILSVAGNRIHGSMREKPLTRFTEIEKATLKALPDVSPELASWSQLKVHRDCHVQTKKRYYSVPHKHVGQQVWLRESETTVRIYHDTEMVATHVRATSEGKWTTLAEHLPPNAHFYLSRDADWCREESSTIGDACKTIVWQLLDDKIIDYLRAAQATIHLKEKYGNKRLEASCQRALAFGCSDYKTVKGILVKGLEYSALPDTEAFNQLEEVYRGSGCYNRDMTLLH